MKRSQIQDVLYLTSASVELGLVMLFDAYEKDDYLVFSPSSREPDSEFHVYKILAAVPAAGAYINNYYEYYVKEIPLEEFSSETLYQDELYDQFMLLLTNFINKVK